MMHPIDRERGTTPRLRPAWTAVALLLALAGGPPARAQQEEGPLLEPPPSAREFSVFSPAGRQGTVTMWTLPDGRTVIREQVQMRGQVFDQEETIRYAASGMPDRLRIRGTSPMGPVAETFEAADGKARWVTQLDAGSAPSGAAFYAPATRMFGSIAPLAEALWRDRDHRLALLPAGEATMARVGEAAVGRGDTAKTVELWVIKGLSLADTVVFMERDGRFFGREGLLPAGYEGDYEPLVKASADAQAADMAAYARRHGQVSTVPVAFVDVNMLDAERGRFLHHQTVIVSGRQIVSVGPAGRVRAPVGARIIPGKGYTLLPGLWDAHMHVQWDAQGLLLLSLGITSLRDPGAPIEATLAREARIAKGDLLFPTAFSSVLIDGKGPLAAQGGIAVSSAEEAVAAVRRAHASGFRGVKFYGSLKPDWLRAGVAEAKRLGLHVHGHVPATMRPREVIEAGYDEITHAYFVIMQAMPDDVVNVSNGLARVLGPGRYARAVDLNAEPMRGLIAEMRRRGTWVDPTLGLIEGLLTTDPGQLSPAQAPYVGVVPPLTAREFLWGGLKPEAGTSRAQYRESFAKIQAMIGALHRAGIPIVAGTDGSGLELVRELELYVGAGLSPAQAIRTATINPARLVGISDRTGSIRVGKEADLVLVEGDPSRRIGDLRRTRWIMLDGRLLNADELRRAAGLTGRPGERRRD